MLPEEPNKGSHGWDSKAVAVRYPQPVTSKLPRVPALLLDPAGRETLAETLLFLAKVGPPPGQCIRHLVIARELGEHLGGHRFGLYYVTCGLIMIAFRVVAKSRLLCLVG